jgi:hypothetical protein
MTSHTDTTPATPFQIRYRVETRGDWAGEPAGRWRPAIAGTLNQTGGPDAAASSADTEEEAEALRALCIAEGASPDDLRIVEIEHPECPTHGTRMACPSCAAAESGRAQRGRPLTDAQRAARQENLAKARAARWMPSRGGVRPRP